ncbi:hypothetical protein BH10ACT11_BH10ACT11_12040 [soil metagenome]
MKTLLRSLRELIFGETWLLPAAIAVLFGLAIAARSTAPHLWRSDGGLLILLGVVVTLVAAVRSTR